jgi:hypothetical protein
MCDPITAGFILGGAQLLGGLQEGHAQSAAANYSAGVYENNAVIADEQGAHALMIGRSLAQRSRMETSTTIAKQTTAYAASGVAVGAGGSVAAVEGSTRLLGELDAKTIGYNAALDAWKSQVQAQNFRAQAALERKRAQDAERAGLITGFTKGAGAYFGARGFRINSGGGGGGTPTAPMPNVAYGP